MELVLRINPQTKMAFLEVYDDVGNKIDTIENIKQFTLENHDNDIGIGSSKEFLVAGTALSINGEEARIQRFMNKDNPRFNQLKSKMGGVVRNHPDDNGNRMYNNQSMIVRDLSEESGVLGFMSDIIIRQQPRGKV